MAATIRRSSQNSNVYGAYGIVSRDSSSLVRFTDQVSNSGCNTMLRWYQDWQMARPSLGSEFQNGYMTIFFSALKEMR